LKKADCSEFGVFIQFFNVTGYVNIKANLYELIEALEIFDLDED